MRWKVERATGAGALLLAAVCFLGAAAPAAAEASLRAAGSAVLPAEPLRQTGAESAVLPAAAPARTAARSGEPVRVAVRFEGIAAGETVILSGEDGAGGTIELPQDGCLTLTLRPGAWGIAAPGGLAAGFTLRDNAAIEAVTGDAWTDGETLVVTRAVRGSVTVTLPAAPEASVICTLAGADYREQRALALSPSAPVSCTFWAVPPGSYTLLRQDAPAAQITITEAQRNVSITLE